MSPKHVAPGTPGATQDPTTGAWLLAEPEPEPEPEPKKRARKKKTEE